MTTEYNTKEKIVQTERSFTVSIKSKRGTDVRDEDTVSMDWTLEEKPPAAAFGDMAAEVTQTMEYLRGHEYGEGSDE